MTGSAQPSGARRTAVVAARDEADRIEATIGALAEASPGIRIFVADDASTDGTAQLALAAGAEVVSRGRPHGKGAN
ncbi:MAG: glycosyltransferase, partial [Solirubrobacterales bacterium]